MRIGPRLWLDRLFTALSLMAVLMIVVALIAILLPMLWRGSSAVVFRGTVEFRRMQLEQHGRGDSDDVRAEVEQAARIRQGAYDLLEQFAIVVDPSGMEKRARQIHREFGKQLEHRGVPEDQAAELQSLSKRLRGELLAAFEATEGPEALTHVQTVLAHAGDMRLAGTVAAQYFELAGRYKNALANVDLGRRAEYGVLFRQVQEALRDLLGPPPGSPLPAIIKDQYGATRWDQATRHMERLLWVEKWLPSRPGELLQKVRVPMEQEFRGTVLTKLFPYVREHVGDMLQPRWTCYWQFFFDDSMSSHYFGGVGPEILGTVLVTALAIAFALPVGVATAAYLVECAGDTRPTRVLRTCVNTLAGVPSIVFGLFGLAFFVIYLLPKLGLREGSSILAGASTLALLVLPVIIRASEEAIRTVPRAYKEAALALGASRFRCFVTVTLPAAMPGILTGLILSMSRAAGETAPILCTAAVAMGPVPTSLMQPTRTLSYSSYDMAVGDKMAMLAPHNQFGMVMTLVAIVLLLNIVAIVIRGRISRKLRGQ
ncbi:MAG TPA: phosphate ABC transporter permease PtsA [Phycisphaerales bacterium]|nr:phosphate ABC transporter permease PtsA [Phycisphaerales bacterium]